ncbi:class I SAM-dependent RNA methyltransferase [Auritidibacter ignavus]|uniref:class I SAM-dependent RNA methyltransferase n=1 Tax=Auritidibacter ignavus TaxID=678932 RepID=UPI00244D5C3B|nr:class I SAM-dependent RNA methyltransferase [Auritidibacter ignavus]WGH84559.1 class I SAM-dependent RNA methyltransferase [Auritidibacter ignavus]
MVNVTTLDETSTLGVGDTGYPEILTLEVGVMAHGGHCVARHEGRVVFVRHAIPGEVVRAVVTSGGAKARFWRADTVNVIRGSEFRRAHQWKLADSLRAYQAGRQPIGGAEYGHITLEHQRRLKAQVFRDTLNRIGRLAVEPQVTSVEADEPTGLHWRTRNRFAVTASGRLAMFVHRSKTMIPVRNIPLAVPELDELHLWDINFLGASSVDVITPGYSQEVMVVIHPATETLAHEPTLNKAINDWRRQLSGLPGTVSAVVSVPQLQPDQKPRTIRLRGRTWVSESVRSLHHGTFTFRVSAEGFWQSHRDAPHILVDAVMQATNPQPGDVIADLYAGAGLFSAFLARAVGETGRVYSVERARQASKDARKNLHEMKQAVVINGRTEKVVSSWAHRPQAPSGQGGLEGRDIDTVVLDPPRSGAGRATIKGINALPASKVVYVSCDPASLARDAKLLAELGWQHQSSEIFDLFPDTHHMESVNIFTR